MTNDSNRDRLSGILSSYATRPVITLFLTPLLIMAVTASFLAVSLALKPELNISLDQLRYLSVAKNMADGNGPRDINDTSGAFTSFRIGYTFIMGAMIRIFGLSEGLVVAMNYLIFFVFVASVYFLGLRLFGWIGGTLGTLFFITIPEVITFGVRNFDSLWPIFIIVSILFLLSRPKDSRYETAYCLSAGFAACYAVLVKETSVLFLPAPAVLLLFGVKPINAGRALWFYAGAVVLALLWVGYALLFLKLSPQFLWTGITPSDVPQMENAWNYVSVLAGGLADYFHNPSGKRGSFVFTRLPLAGGMILALGWSLWLAMKGASSHRVLLVTLILFLPLSAMAGAMEMRFSQNFILVVIFCLLMGTAFATLTEAITNRFPGLVKKRYVAIIALFAGAGMLFTLLNTSSGKIAMEHLALSFHDSHIEIAYSGHKSVRALNKLPEGVVITGDYFGELSRSVFLFGKGRASVPISFREYSSGERIPSRVGAVVTRVFKDPARRDNAIFLFDADAFMRTLEDTKAKYVMVPGGMAAVAVWIKDNVGAEKILTFPRRNEPPDTLIILPETRKAIGQSADARRIYISRATVEMLSRLKKENPAVHNDVVDWLFRRELRLEEDAVSQILEGKTNGQRHVIVTLAPF